VGLPGKRTENNSGQREGPSRLKTDR